MSRLLRQRTIEGNEIRFSEDRIQIDERYPKFCSKRGVNIGVMRDEAHAERLGETKNLRSDIADANRSEHPADQSDPIMIEALIESTRALPREVVFDEQPAAERKEEGNGRDSDWATYAVRSSHEGNPSVGAGGDVDAIVADADLGDQAEPTVRRNALARKAWKEQN